MEYSGEKTDKGLAASLTAALGRAYRLFASIETSVCILGLMAVCYLIGTVLPQGADLSEYAREGGRLVFLVSLFDLLDFFSSPVFLFLALLLLLNLVTCTYERYPSVFTKDACPREFEPLHSIALTQDIKEAFVKVREAFVKELGFKPALSESLWTVVEKGLPYRPLTWLYHAGIIVCFLGFALTYLFAYEGTVTLSPKRVQTVVPEDTGRLKSLWKKKDDPTDFHLLLEDFGTEYIQSPDLNYPDDRAARLAIGLGWSSPAYELHEDSLFVKGWKARIKVVKGKETLYEKTAEVNSPLKYGGYAFHLAGWEDTVKVSVDSNPILLEAKAGDPLFVPGLLDPVVFGGVKAGKVRKLDGSMAEIEAFTTVKRMVKGREEYLGKVRIGESIDINGRRITLAGFETGSVLNYRYDPGVGVLWAGGLVALVTMALRFYIGWCMAAYNIVEKDGIVYLELFIAVKGLGFSPERIVKALEHSLTKDDIRPLPLPPFK